MIMTGTGSAPASVPAKCAISSPGAPVAAAPSTSAAISGFAAIISRMIFGPSPSRTVIDGRKPEFLQQRTRRAGDQPLGMQPRFFLDRRLDAAERDELLRRDHGEDLDPAAGLHRTPGGETQRDPASGLSSITTR